MIRLISSILIFIISFNYAVAQTNNKAVTANDIIILIDNPILQKIDSELEINKNLKFLDIVKLKNIDLDNEKVQISEPFIAWLDISNTSLVNNIKWEKFSIDSSLTISLPKNMKFVSKKGKKITDVNGSYKEELFMNDIINVNVVYLEQKKFFDINKPNSDGVINVPKAYLNYYGYEAYYDVIEGYEGDKRNILTIVKKNRHNYYYIVVSIQPKFYTKNNELIARKILFSVRLQPENTTTIPLYTLTGDNVRVRAEAGTNSAVLATLSKGAKVKLIKRTDVTLTVGEKNGYWALVEFTKDKKAVQGYILDVYLKEEK